MNNEAKQQKRAVGLELSFGGLRAQRAAHGNQPKEKTSPTAPIHSLSSTAQQLSLLWLWLEKPTKELSLLLVCLRVGAVVELSLLGYGWGRWPKAGSQQKRRAQPNKPTHFFINFISLSLSFFCCSLFSFHQLFFAEEAKEKID